MTNMLSTVDYILFALFLVVSFIIGSMPIIQKKASEVNYILADRQLGAVPVALSVFVSFWSATAILGYTSEAYRYGTQFALICIGNLLSTVLTAKIFIPKYRSLNLVSLYEYLELRFHRSLKLAASLCFIFQNLLYLSVALYSPSLAMQQALGLSMLVSLGLVAFVCIAYSALGGIKGVIFSDVFQFIVITIGLLTILISGLVKIGGFSNMATANRYGDRVEFFVFNFDPRTRHTFFSLIIGSCGLSLGVYSFNQVNVQRFLTIRTDKLTTIAIYLNLLGLCFSLIICMLIGMVMYAYYKSCDPRLNGTIAKYDLILPLFVTEIIGNIPGFTGLLLATICSGTMSSVSSSLNSMAAVVLYDFLKPFFKSVNFTHWVMILRIITIILGLVSFALTFIISHVPYVLQAALSILGMYSGPVTGLFLIGFYFPFVRWKAALSGFMCSLLFQTWLLIGTILYAAQLQTPAKLMNTSGCTNLNTSVVTNTSEPTELTGILGFYAISYMWHSITGILSCMFVVLIVSVVIGDYKQRVDVDEKLIIRLFKKSKLMESDTENIEVL